MWITLNKLKSEYLFFFYKFPTTTNFISSEQKQMHTFLFLKRYRLLYEFFLISSKNDFINNLHALKKIFKSVFYILFWLKLRISYYINNWIYTTNHKRIAVNYFWFVILSGIVGMVLATLIRLEFTYPGVGIFAGDSLQYLSLVTAHGVIMVFFMIMPLLFGAFANFLLPTQLGVHDVAFPRLNSAAFWFLPGGLLMLCQLVCVDRRYQRMNCFNIREVQSLLKKRFFVDLINTHDHHNLLNQTAVGIRFKTNNINTINSNLFTFYNFGIDFSSKIRNMHFNDSYIIANSHTSFKMNSLFFFFIENSQNTFLYYINNFYFLFLINLISFYNTFFKSNFLFNIIYKFLSLFDDFFFVFSNFFNNFISFFSFFSILEKQKLINTYLINTTFFYEIFLTFISKLFLFFNTLINFKISFENLKFDMFVCFHTEIDNIFNFNYLYFFNFNYIVVDLHFFFLFFHQINFFSFRKIFSFLINFFNLNPFPDLKSIISALLLLNNNGNMVSGLYPFFMFNINIDSIKMYEKKNKSLASYFNNWGSWDLDYNSYFVYVYVLVYSIAALPYSLYYFFKNFFNFSNFDSLTKELHDFFVNWYLALLINDNLALWIFQKISKSVDFGSNGFWVSFKSLIISLIFAIFDFFFNFLIFPAITASFLFIFNGLSFILSNLFHYLFRIFFFFSNCIASIFFGFETNFIFNNFYHISSFKFKNNFFNDHSNVENYWYSSNFFNDAGTDWAIKHTNEESSENTRACRFSNPILRYDYKSGDYFPKLYKEIYPYLFQTIANVSGGLRIAPWFCSEKFLEGFNITFSNYFSNLEKFPSANIFAHSWTTNKFSLTDGFYNFFYLLTNDFELLNKKWISLNSLNQKFYRMFSTSSMQQRIYSNWRQLKFTREAWRCKLLAARHQKTLFKRYVHEDGIFWSIERNARDLLPGWAMITPFASRTRFTAVGKTDIGLFGVLLVLNSSIISAANFLVTYRYLSTLNNRKMRDARAFFTEGIMVASWMMIAANPMLVIGIVMLISDRHWQTSFFDYSGGGDTVLFQHMFWFFGHPEVYIIIIPTFGFTNTILSFHLKKRISARASLIYSMYTIAFLGFFVWGHHMYMVGLAHTTRMLFSTLTVMISVPAATKIMHWCVTIVNSSFATELPVLFILTYVFLFITGGISGMCVAHTGMDVLFHDTFYVVGHFHIMLAGSAMFASFGAFYFYFPAVFGVRYSKIYAYLHYSYYLLGQFMTVIPMIWLGYAGMPRRVLDYPASMGGWHSVISAGHMLSVAGLMAFFIMIFDSLRQNKAVIRNTFGIARYNTRLNFYLYEISRLTYAQQRGLSFFKLMKPRAIKLNNLNYFNFEKYETVLLSYTFSYKNNRNNK